jgi:hypothetical protein
VSSHSTFRAKKNSRLNCVPNYQNSRNKYQMTSKLNMRYVVGKGIFKGSNFFLKRFSIEVHMLRETLLK